MKTNLRKLLPLAIAALCAGVGLPSPAPAQRTPEGRANIFDLYYLHDRGCVEVMNGGADSRRRPDFFILTPHGADLVEIPGNLDKILPLED